MTHCEDAVCICALSTRLPNGREKSSPCEHRMRINRPTALMAGFAKALRAYCLEKPPSISEMIDIALGIGYLGIDEVTDAHRDVLLPMIAKTKKDRERLTLSDGFKSILYASHLYARPDA